MKLYFFLFFVLVGYATYAQVQQPGRYEIELGPFEDSYHILVGEDDGALLYKPLLEFQSGKQLWQFSKLDTTLKKSWQKAYYIDRNYIFRGFVYHENFYSFLFQITSHGARDLYLLRLDALTGDTTQYIIRNLVPLQLQAFEMTDGAALIGGYYNQEPVVIYYSLVTGKTKVLPGIFGNKTELVQLKIEGDLIKVLVSTRTFDKRNTLGIKTYDMEGEYLDNYVFKPAEDYGLIFGQVAEVENKGTIISGTYGIRRSEYSRGLFIAQHTVDQDQVIKYYNYADFDNFFSYMKAKRQTRITNRIARKKINGKKVKFNYRLLVHEIIKSDDGYIMIGEAFYPKYNNNATFSGISSYGMHSGGQSYTPTTFAGYRYTHAVVIGFDKNGEKLWDNSFEIEDVQSFDLNQYVHADVQGDKVVLLYLYNNEIRSKIISGPEVLEGKSFDNVKMTFDDDVASKSNIFNVGGLEKWYGHYFLAYGVQKIKNLHDSGVKLNRKVFYVNKLLYAEKEQDSTVSSQ